MPLSASFFQLSSGMTQALDNIVELGATLAQLSRQRIKQKATHFVWTISASDEP